MRLWYARRGVPWSPFLACLALAVLAAGLLQQWPRFAGILAPGAMAASAAAVGYVLDEPAAAAVGVTPRGGRWALVTRAGVGLVPALLWLGFVATAPAASALHETTWGTVGLIGQMVALALAWAAARHGTATPGSAVAPTVAGLILTPFVIGPMLGWNGL